MNPIYLFFDVLIGWPLAVAIFVLNLSAKGGLNRLIGITVCSIVGIAALGLGWILTVEGIPYSDSTVVIYPAAGFISLCIGAIVGVFGTIRSLTIKEEIDQIDFTEGIGELIRGMFDIFLPYRKPKKK